jgi:hypothetical protein
MQKNQVMCAASWQSILPHLVALKSANNIPASNLKLPKISCLLPASSWDHHVRASEADMYQTFHSSLFKQNVIFFASQTLTVTQFHVWLICNGSGCELVSQCCDSYEYCVACCMDPAWVRLQQILFSLQFIFLQCFVLTCGLHDGCSFV